jgi:uncharacterized protein
MKKNKQKALYAGRFSTWLRKMRKALAENRGMNVPCGACDVCCRSSYFIHIKPEETRTLRQIPKELLFPAPLLPKGHMVLGYDKYGRCPMLHKKCSIYRSRPDTCRSFDCRILAATGLAVKGNNLIAQQAQRWEFSCPTNNGRNLFSAVQAAAAFLAKHPECIRDNLAPKDEIQLAVLAIKVYDVFLNNNSADIPSRTTGDSKISMQVLKSYKKFEKRSRI